MNTSLSISFELIYLINWLLKNQTEDLNKLVQNALNKGFAEKLVQLNEENQSKLAEEMPVAILDLLFYLEDSLLDNLEEMELTSLQGEALAPIIKKIDSSNIDTNTLWISLQQAKEAIAKSKIENRNPIKQNNSKKILLEKILQNWKPGQDETLN